MQANIEEILYSSNMFSYNHSYNAHRGSADILQAVYSTTVDTMDQETGDQRKKITF